MGYRIDIDRNGCINCGICMDVCPVEALDMSRPQGDGIEGLPAIPWLMEDPVQVGECVGCEICGPMSGARDHGRDDVRTDPSLAPAGSSDPRCGGRGQPRLDPAVRRHA